MAADAGIAVLLHDAAAAPGGRLGGLAPGAARFDLAGLPELRQLQDLRGPSGSRTKGCSTAITVWRKRACSTNWRTATRPRQAR